MNQNDLLMLWCQQQMDKQREGCQQQMDKQREALSTEIEQKIKDEITRTHPIGSVYVSSTNSNPSALFGGTWELFDKEFAYKYDGTLANYVSLNKTNASAVTGNLRWQGHRIICATSVTSAVAITDTTLEMFTFNLAKIGVSSLIPLPYTYFSDAGNAVLNYYVSGDGIFSTRDVIVRGSASASLAASTQSFVYELYCSHSAMLDSFCDKFYWKRTA